MFTRFARRRSQPLLVTRAYGASGGRLGLARTGRRARGTEDAVRHYLKMRADRWFIVAMLFLAAIPIGATIGAMWNDIKLMIWGY